MIRYYDWIAHHASRRPDKVAVLDLAIDRRLTYRELDRRASRLASALRSMGVGRGDRVAILAHNCAEFFDLQFACGRLGAIMVPLNWRLAAPELDYILRDCAPEVLIADRAFAALVEQVRKLGVSAAVLDLEPGDPTSGYERALAAAADGFEAEVVALSEPSTIMYTSGTTGHPKGAIITHQMTFFNVVNLGVPALITPQTVQLVVLPLFHTGGLNCYANPVLHAGGALLVMKSFDPGEALDVIGDPKHGVTHFFGVPAPYLFMMQHPKFQGCDLSRLQIAGVGGAPCALPILETWAARGVPLVQGYGMTETSPSASMLDATDAIRKTGSAGKPMLHTEIRIVDEAGRDVPPGTVGELWTRGPNITPGYWNKPEATAAAFTEGWLHTGDAARVDEEGFIYIVDRWKDMYISGGENVYPAEVENVLYQLPQIAEAAVIGVPNERWGEVGMVVAALKPGATITEAQVIEHCFGKLARFKQPQHVRFVDALPRNATGKVLKRELRTQFVGTATPAIT